MRGVARDFSVDVQGHVAGHPVPDINFALLWSAGENAYLVVTGKRDVHTAKIVK